MKKQEAFAAWARGKAISFEDIKDTEESIKRLSVLDGVLKDKRVLFLGEEHHWVQQKYEYRRIVLPYLVSRGFSVVCEELGWSDGMRVNSYISSGDESYLDIIATYGYKGDAREDREDKLEGLFSGMEESYPLKSFSVQQTRFARFLRGLKGIRYFGMDVNAQPAGGYRDIDDLLRGEPDVEELRALLRRIPGETAGQEIIRLGRLISYIDSERGHLSGLLGQERYSLVSHSAACMRDSLQYLSMVNASKDYKELCRAMAYREEMMQRSAQFILSGIKPEEKIVFMAHNRHLSKDMGAIKNPGAAPPGGGIVPSVGTYLYQKYPSQVFSIWLLLDRGRSSQPMKSLSSEYISKPGSLNEALSRVGPKFLLPLYEAGKGVPFVNRQSTIVGIYNAPFKAVISRQADAVFFMREASPLDNR